MGHVAPHILFILTDQLRADCLGCAGHPLVQTPHIDRLAAEGVRFTHAFTSSPICVPARMSIASGLYPHNSNMWQNDAGMPLDADTYMKHLRGQGYRTCAIGKNHLYLMEDTDLYDNTDNYHAIGFDHIEDMPGAWACLITRSIYTDYLAEVGLLDRLREYLGDLEAKPDEERRFVAEALPIPAEAYIDAFVPRRVTRYVEEYDSDQPSFVYVGFQGPHEPWDAPDEYARLYPPEQVPAPIPELPPGDWLPARSLRYQRWAQYYQPPNPRAGQEIAARYFGKITHLDEGVGRIVAAYQRTGWWDNTLVIFASDNGEMLGDLGRLSKSVCYDSALRVPLIVRMPGGAGAGTTHPAFVETIDIHGTILEAAGSTISTDKDCRSVLPLIRGEVPSIRSDVLAEAHVHYMLRTPDWKILIGRDGLTILLFDLAADPHEQRNLCGHPDYAQRELELRSLLLTRIASNTYRPGKYDPELSTHSWDEAEQE